MEISSLKSKVMAFKEQILIRTNSVIDSTIMKQVNTSTYLGCKILYRVEKDVTSKTCKFLQILGILNNVLKPNLVQRQS